MRIQYVTTNGLDKETVINYYNKLDEQLRCIVKYLKRSLDNLNEFKCDLSDCYLIDDSTVSDVDITGIKKDISNKISYIENTILPAIKTKAKGIKNTVVEEEPIVEEIKSVLPINKGKNINIGMTVKNQLK